MFNSFHVLSGVAGALPQGGGELVNILMKGYDDIHRIVSPFGGFEPSAREQEQVYVPEPFGFRGCVFFRKDFGEFEDRFYSHKGQHPDAVGGSLAVVSYDCEGFQVKHRCGRIVLSYEQPYKPVFEASLRLGLFSSGYPGLDLAKNVLCGL